MKILLLGGTGAMGVALANILSETEHEVHITSRTERSNYKNIKYIVGNAKDDDFLYPLLEKNSYDVVVDFMIYSTEIFKTRASRLLAATGQYVFLSSSRVYAESKQPITEASPRLLDVCKDEDYLKTDEYALTKARQEDILRNSKYKNWTIIRPYITYNAERLQLGVFEKEQWLFRALKGRTIVFSRDIADHISSLTYGYDVAYGISKILGNSEAWGQAIHFVSPCAMKWSSMLEIYQKVIFELTGKYPAVKYIETNEPILSFLNKYQIKYDRLYDREFNSRNADEIIKEKINYSPFETGVRLSLKAFIDQSCPFKDISWYYEACLDRITGEFSTLKDIPGIMLKLRYIYWRFIRKT